MLRTANDGTYPGKGTRLVTFEPDGTVAALGETFGSYDIDEWNDFDIRYERPDGGDTVTLSFEINGAERGSVERDVTGYEDDLSYVSLQGGDFAIYWDNFDVSEEGESTTKLLEATFEEATTDSYPADWVKNGNEDQQVVGDVVRAVPREATSRDVAVVFESLWGVTGDASVTSTVNGTSYEFTGGETDASFAALVGTSEGESGAVFAVRAPDTETASDVARQLTGSELGE
jgi:hypothetical protein